LFISARGRTPSLEETGDPPEQPTRSSRSGQLKKHREDTAEQWARIPVSGSLYDGQTNGKSKKENNLAWHRAHTHIPVQWGKEARGTYQPHFSLLAQGMGRAGRCLNTGHPLSRRRLPEPLRKQDPERTSPQSSLAFPASSPQEGQRMLTTTTKQHPRAPAAGTSPPFLNSSSMASSLVSLKTKCSG